MISSLLEPLPWCLRSVMRNMWMPLLFEVNTVASILICEISAECSLAVSHGTIKKRSHSLMARYSEKKVLKIFFLDSVLRSWVEIKFKVRERKTECRESARAHTHILTLSGWHACTHAHIKTWEGGGCGREKNTCFSVNTAASVCFCFSSRICVSAHACFVLWGFLGESFQIFSRRVSEWKLFTG